MLQLSLSTISTHNWQPLQTVNEFCAETIIALHPWRILQTLVLIYVEECAQGKDTEATDQS